MVKNYIPERGDIVWVNFNPSKGHEQSGLRPAIIVSGKSYNSIGLALACPITSKIKGYPFEVILENEKVEGAVLSDQIRTLDWKERGVKFACSASSLTITTVQKNLSKLILC